MLTEVRQCVEDALIGAQRPAVLFSGGKDSLLLTALVRELRSDFCVIWFCTGEPDEHVRAVIRDWGLTGLSWTPADMYLLAEHGERVQVQEFDFGGTRFPVVTDLSVGKRCSRKLPQFTGVMNPGFDVLLWGAKDCDRHWLKGAASFPPDGHPLGAARLYAPLRYMTDVEVRRAIEHLGLPYTPQADSLPMCSACMENDGEVDCPELGQRIRAEKVNWVPGLTAFRQRFLLEA